MRSDFAVLTSSIAIFFLSSLALWRDCIHCDGDRSTEVVQAVRSQLNSDLPLRATLLPDLTDDLLYLETKGLAHPPKTEVRVVSFFAVTPCMYELKGNFVVSESVELDRQREWIIAVGPGDEAKYFLEGFSSSVAEFNKLMKGLDLRITDARGAIDIFDFFLKVARGQQFRSQVISDDLQLESLALADFRIRFPTSQRRQAFDAWWRGLPSSAKTSIVPPRSNPLKGGFEVKYFLYSEGIVHQESLTVNADATVLEGKSIVALR